MHNVKVSVKDRYSYHSLRLSSITESICIPALSAIYTSSMLTGSEPSGRNENTGALLSARRDLTQEQ